jgi:hypothetical protein
VPDFVARVDRMADPRSRRGIRHDLASVITAVCALLAGRNTCAAVSRWAADAPAEIAEALRYRAIDTPVGRFYLAFALHDQSPGHPRLPWSVWSNWPPASGPNPWARPTSSSTGSASVTRGAGRRKSFA